uniref:Costars domain-containing protein n=1 Tax=Haplochromis burtoni TaxID=8153 RepID=A0A3Q2VCS2_HAPBU
MSLDLLVLGIQQLGSENAKGKFITKFSLVATLTATRKKVIAFQGELVLQSVHNNVDIIRLQE